MEQHFYIGQLELIFHLDGMMHLDDYDMKFSKPLFPVLKSIHVYFTRVSEFALPEGEPFSIRGSKAWITAEGEYRLYNHMSSEKPSVFSCWAGDDRIDIYVLSNAWEQFIGNLRPWFHVHLEELLLGCDAIVLHSASIIYRGQAILFSAPSGTGKSTQTDLWHKFRSGVTDINGDRTLLQRTENGWLGCGFPIYGSSGRCEHIAAPIAAIVIIRQAPEDRVFELDLMEKIVFLYSEITVLPIYQNNVSKVIDLLEDLVQNVRVLRLDCTKEASAVDLLHHFLWGE